MSGNNIDLANLPESTQLTQLQLALYFGVSSKTIGRMAKRGELPKPIRVGRKPYWLAGEVYAVVLAKQRRKQAFYERMGVKLCTAALIKNPLLTAFSMRESEEVDDETVGSNKDGSDA